MEQSILHNGMALRNKASPPRWKGFAKKSHSVTKDWLCFAKPIIINIHTGLLRSKVNPSQRIGFAKQSRSTTMEIICEAIPIFLKGLVLRSKASPSQRIGLALRSKADRSTTKVPLFKAQPIATNDWLCEAEPIHLDGEALRSKAIHQDGEALRSKAKPSQRNGFAKQSQSITMERICEAQQIRHRGLAVQKSM